MTDRSLKEIVFEALDNAEENGYSMNHECSSETAEDLVQYCSDVEDKHPIEIFRFIIDWKIKKGYL